MFFHTVDFVQYIWKLINVLSVVLDSLNCTSYDNNETIIKDFQVVVEQTFNTIIFKSYKRPWSFTIGKGIHK